MELEAELNSLKAEDYLLKCKAAEKKAAEYAALCMAMHFSMLETMRTNMTETVKIHENMTQTGRSVLETMMMKSTTRTMETMETMETIETIVHHEDDGDDTTGKYMSRPSLFGAYFGPYDPEL